MKIRLSKDILLYMISFASSFLLYMFLDSYNSFNSISFISGMLNILIVAKTYEYCSRNLWKN